MNAKRVLVALDSSEQSEQVLEQALEQSQAPGSHLLIVHVLQLDIQVETNPLIGLGTLADTGMYSTLQRLKQERYDQEITKVNTWVQQYEQRALEKGISTEVMCLLGTPGQQICDRAKEWKADLIVLGRRGVQGIREVVLGSVSNYVLHHAPCSVLIVQKQWSEVDALEQDAQTHSPV
jgi:nucleotide-binding universal stress UspA family protein